MVCIEQLILTMIKNDCIQNLFIYTDLGGAVNTESSIPLDAVIEPVRIIEPSS
jgi:hypothetical protein